ncbi:MAG TPA: 6,7-dimethyl-8-ribityllumazine synthase [Acidimicrobiales bacterium]|nr:6,7-dimethyl-8-ribityllumazine synthase [Acidimicrobiales bacterium]
MSAERPAPAALDGTGMSIAIAWSRFNEEITANLLAGARRALEGHGVAPDRIDVRAVPGAFELPLVAKHLAASGRYDAVVTVGAVIRGETGHYELVAQAAADGIARAALDTGVPVIFGVLATETREQARARSGGELGNRGEDAALAAIEMAEVLRGIAPPSATESDVRADRERPDGGPPA